MTENFAGGGGGRISVLLLFETTKNAAGGVWWGVGGGRGGGVGGGGGGEDKLAPDKTVSSLGSENPGWEGRSTSVHFGVSESLLSTLGEFICLECFSFQVTFYCWSYSAN